jgi:tetratricopeptide (TPR) repeat protein
LWGRAGRRGGAEALARQNRTVILLEPTSRLGGQLTSQGVATPDENRFIEQERGPGTRAYRALREAARARYAALPNIKSGRAQNVGQNWVSRVSAEPMVWEAIIRERLAPFIERGLIKRVLLRHALVSVARFPGNNRVSYADAADLDSGRITRIGAQYLIDASEMGDGLALSGAPWTVGQEARSAYDEPSAPPYRRPEWVQSFTYCFALRYDPNGPRKLVAKPAEYEYFKTLGEYTLDYVYSDERGTVTYKVFERAPKTFGSWWTYRRLLAASSFQQPGPAPTDPFANDLALINWRGNDYHEKSVFGKTLDEQIRVLARGKAFAQGFLYWVQNECPRDDGSGFGYPEMTLDEAAMGTSDGFSAHPYVRESRRLLAEFTLTENHLIRPDPNGNASLPVGEAFFDSVGIALYAIDIHPAQGEPPLLEPALPYHLPLGAFIARSGPANVLPGAKNFGASRLALASARMHPTEWQVGEIAGNLAAFCLARRPRPRPGPQHPRPAPSLSSPTPRKRRHHPLVRRPASDAARRHNHSMKRATERAELEARTLFNAGQFEQAARVLEQATQDDLAPEDATYLLLHLGYIRGVMGDTGRAIEAYQTALARTPGNGELHARLGVAHHEADRFEDAERCYSAAIQNGFAPFWVYTNLGRGQIERGDYAGAHVSLDTALLLNPDDALTHEIVGYFAGLEKDWGRSLAGYERAATLDPDRAELHTQIGELLLYQRRYREAAQAYRRALERDPASEKARTGLAPHPKRADSLCGPGTVRRLRQHSRVGADRHRRAHVSRRRRPRILQASGDRAMRGLVRTARAPGLATPAPPLAVRRRGSHTPQRGERRVRHLPQPGLRKP